MKHLLAILVAVSMSVLPASAAKTVVPKLQRVDSKASSAAGTQAAGQAATQQPSSPLDDPFEIKHSYPGTSVATDLVALDIKSDLGKGVCSGTRFHTRWIITAAHCFDKLFDTSTNPRIVFGVKKLSNGVWQVGLSEPKTGMPTNATLYFYRNGYSQINNRYSHAEDIAIIGLDKDDKVMALMNKNLKELEVSSAQMQNVTAMLAKNKAPASAQAEQVASVQASSSKKMSKTINDKKRFLQLPLNGYHFMTFSPESARAELAGRTAYGYWFEPVVDQNNVVINRKLPVERDFTYKKITQSDDHAVHWKGGEELGMSGTPFIIRGYIVGVGSGQGTTPLFTDDFTAFLKRSMGADYQQGLCVRSVANEESITQRAQP